jgi:hypothetical protein
VGIPLLLLCFRYIRADCGVVCLEAGNYALSMVNQGKEIAVTTFDGASWKCVRHYVRRCEENSWKCVR